MKIEEYLAVDGQPILIPDQKTEKLSFKVNDKRMNDWEDDKKPKLYRPIRPKGCNLAKIRTHFPSFVRPIFPDHLRENKGEWSGVFASQHLNGAKNGSFILELGLGFNTKSRVQIQWHLEDEDRPDPLGVFTEGWLDFVTEAGLKEGDCVLFQLLEPELLSVEILERVSVTNHEEPNPVKPDPGEPVVEKIRNSNQRMGESTAKSRWEVARKGVIENKGKREIERSERSLRTRRRGQNNETIGHKLEKEKNVNVFDNMILIPSRGSIKSKSFDVQKKKEQDKIGGKPVRNSSLDEKKSKKDIQIISIGRKKVASKKREKKMSGERNKLEDGQKNDKKNSEVISPLSFKVTKRKRKIMKKDTSRKRICDSKNENSDVWLNPESIISICKKPVPSREVIPGKVYLTEDWISQRRPVTEEDRDKAWKEASAFVRKENGRFPTVMKELVPSQVYRGFWFGGIQKEFRRQYLPNGNTTIILKDESGRQWKAKWKGNNHTNSGISGGWRSFAIDHGLEEFDVCVFQLVTEISAGIPILVVNIFRAVEPPNGKESYPIKKSFPRVELSNEKTNYFTKASKHLSSLKARVSKLKNFSF